MRCNVSRWILSLNKRKMNVFHSVWHLFSYFYYYFTFFILTHTFYYFSLILCVFFKLEMY
jgi:hypothetical protein